MSRSSPVFRLIAGLFALMLLLAACGGDDEEPTGGGDGGGDQTEAQGDATGGECGGQGGTELTLVAENTTFKPTELSAAAGEQVTVSFENKDSLPHTFTIADLDCDTGTVDGGDTATLSFTMPQTETQFVCTIHSNMVGSLVPSS